MLSRILIAVRPPRTKAARIVNEQLLALTRPHFKIYDSLGKYGLVLDWQQSDACLMENMTAWKADASIAFESCTQAYGTNTVDPVHTFHPWDIELPADWASNSHSSFYGQNLT